MKFDVPRPPAAPLAVVQADAVSLVALARDAPRHAGVRRLRAASVHVHLELHYIHILLFILLKQSWFSDGKAKGAIRVRIFH